MDLDVTLTNTESSEEPVGKSREKVLKLSCHIDGGANPINHM